LCIARREISRHLAFGKRRPGALQIRAQAKSRKFESQSTLVASCLSSRPITPGNNDRDDALKVFSQNLLDYMPVVFMWGFSR
jgi:hypothetical protein